LFATGSATRRNASPTALCDPLAKVRFAHLAAGDATDNLIGFIRIAGRRGPGSAIALHELDRGQEGAALVAVRERVVLDEMRSPSEALEDLLVALDADPKALAEVCILSASLDVGGNCAQDLLVDRDLIDAGDRLELLRLVDG
jgi:hypothetical protein